MHPASLDPGFRDYLLQIVDVSERQLDKILVELMDHWSETEREHALRRHHELRRDGVPTRRIYARIRSELPARRYAPRPLSERQIRRLIYG
jgi:hypothetical protein